MGKFHTALSTEHQAFALQQKMFFVATAPLQQDGHINLSPKGMDTFYILSPTQVMYLDFIGSGNETSAHLLENQRITIMFCAFDGKPNILRMYGKGSTILPSNPAWKTYYTHFEAANYPNVRQIFIINIDMVQTSCGYGVPFYAYQGERTIMSDWAARKGEEGLATYIQNNNLTSIDGLPTDYAVRE